MIKILGCERILFCEGGEIGRYKFTCLTEFASKTLVYFLEVQENMQDHACFLNGCLLYYTSIIML